MNNYNEDVFKFSDEQDNNLEQTNNFNYDSISGLGESNYENEDLFKLEDNQSNSMYDNNIDSTTDYNNTIDAINNYNDYNQNTDYENINNVFNTEVENGQINEENTYNIPYENNMINLNNNGAMLDTYLNNNYENYMMDTLTGTANNQDANNMPENGIVEEVKIPIIEHNAFDSVPEENPTNARLEPSSVDEPMIGEVQDLVEEHDVFDPVSEESVNLYERAVPEENLANTELESSSVDESIIEENVEESELKESNEESNKNKFENIVMSDTSIEELNKLTEYNNETIETTDISELFDKVSVNVKDASDIFRKNTEMKQKIDSRFNELKQLQSEVETAKKNQMDEINKYKEEVLNKLTEKKEEIEKRLNTLKELQASLEKEKKEFEEYKKKEQDNISKVQKEVQDAYDDRREELNHIEDILRKQKDSLDEERNQLSLDRIQYEADKNELANNLLKFNEIVNSFTNGVEGIEQ